jgi:hypothetical protein
MNHYRCKPLIDAAVLEFDSAVIGFFTGAVEKTVLFQERIVVQLCTPVAGIERS